MTEAVELRDGTEIDLRLAGAKCRGLHKVFIHSLLFSGFDSGGKRT